MATVLQPIVNELNTVLVQLRTELRGLQTDADGSGIAILSLVGGLIPNNVPIIFRFFLAIHI